MHESRRTSHNQREPQDVRIIDNQQHHTTQNELPRCTPHSSQRTKYFQQHVNAQTPNSAVNPVQNINNQSKEPKWDHQAIEDPNFIITHKANKLDSFLNASDAPQYTNVSEGEVRRKQKAEKAILIALKDSRFGVEQEEDWERHINDFETLSFDSQLRSKDLTYLLRLSLCYQASSVHRS